METPQHAHEQPSHQPRAPSEEKEGTVHRLPHVQPVTRARERFAADLARYYRMSGATSRLARLKVVLGTEGVWAVALYRLGQYLREEAPAPVRLAGKLPYGIAHRLLQMALGIHLFPETQIGPGLYIGHFGGIWISPKAQIGANCNINHAVTIGAAGTGRSAPRLGDHVWVGPGALISGPVKVGSNVVVGANSLVTTNVPDGALMLGVPAKVVSYTGSEKMVRTAG